MAKGLVLSWVESCDVRKDYQPCTLPTHLISSACNLEPALDYKSSMHAYINAGVVLHKFPIKIH